MVIDGALSGLKSRAGFSLAMCIFFLLTIPFLGLYYMPPSFYFMHKEKLQWEKEDLKKLQHGIQRYLKENSRYPMSMEELIFNGHKRYIRKNYLETYPAIRLSFNKKGELIGAFLEKNKDKL
ncbi:hypothetical protein ACFL35_15080 [Candidatus Riflebacteria bacterium]